MKINLNKSFPSADNFLNTVKATDDFVSKGKGGGNIEKGVSSNKHKHKLFNSTPSFKDNLSATKYRIYYLLKERKSAKSAEFKFTTQAAEEDNLGKMVEVKSTDYAKLTFSGFTTEELERDANKLRDYSEWCVSHIINVTPGATFLIPDINARGGSRKKNKSKKNKKKQNRTVKKNKGFSKRINSKKKNSIKIVKRTARIKYLQQIPI